MKKKWGILAAIVLCVVIVVGIVMIANAGKFEFNGMKISEFTDDINAMLDTYDSEITFDGFEKVDGIYSWESDSGLLVELSDGKSLYTVSFSASYSLLGMSEDEIAKLLSDDITVFVAFVSVLDPNVDAVALADDLDMEKVTEVETEISTSSYLYRNITSTGDEGLFFVRYTTMRNIPDFLNQ